MNSNTIWNWLELAAHITTEEPLLRVDVTDNSIDHATGRPGAPLSPADMKRRVEFYFTANIDTNWSALAQHFGYRL